MKRRQVKRRRKQWSDARVIKKCSVAIRVQWALVVMTAERGSIVVTPTRTMLSTRTGIKRLNTISTALTVLVKAGWIEREHIPVGKDHKTMLRIVVRRMPHVLLHTGGVAVCNSRRCTSVQQLVLHDSLKRGVATKPPPPTASLGVEPGHPPDGYPNLHPYEQKDGDPEWLHGPSSLTEETKHAK